MCLRFDTCFGVVHADRDDGCYHHRPSSAAKGHATTGGTRGTTPPPVPRDAGRHAANGRLGASHLPAVAAEEAFAGAQEKPYAYAVADEPPRRPAAARNKNKVVDPAVGHGNGGHHQHEDASEYYYAATTATAHDHERY